MLSEIVNFIVRMLTIIGLFICAIKHNNQFRYILTILLICTLFDNIKNAIEKNMEKLK